MKWYQYLIITFVTVILWDTVRDFLLINYSEEIKKIIKNFKYRKGGDSMAQWLQGKKTYLAAGAIAIVVFCWQVGWFSTELATTLLGLLGAGGLAALRAGINKNNVDKE